MESLKLSDIIKRTPVQEKKPERQIQKNNEFKKMLEEKKSSKKEDIPEKKQEVVSPFALISPMALNIQQMPTEEQNPTTQVVGEMTVETKTQENFVFGNTQAEETPMVPMVAESLQEEQGLQGQTKVTETNMLKNVTKAERKTELPIEPVGKQETEKPISETNSYQKHEDLKAKTSTTIRKESKENPQEKAVENTENVSFHTKVSSMTENRVETKGEEKTVSHITVKQPEEIPTKVLQELISKSADGRKEFEIQITPKNLGKIAVKLLYEDGQTTVSILCSEKSTMELLANRAKEIGNVMEQNLGSPTTIIVDKQENDNLNQEMQENDHSGRDSEQERQREEQNRQKAGETEQFLGKLRLGLLSEKIG